MKIRTRISVIFSLSFVVILTATALFYLINFINARKKEVFNYVYTFSRISTRQIINEYEKYCGEAPLLIYRNLYSIFELNPYLNKFYVASTDGRVLFDTDEAKTGYIGVKAVQDSMLKFIKKMEPSYIMQKRNGKFAITVFTPYFDEYGIHRYTVVYVYHMTSELFLIKKTIAEVITILFVAIIISIIIGNIISSRITDNLAKLEKAALSFEKGDFYASFNIKSNDEIGELSRVFERMRVSIQKYIKQMEKTVWELRKLDKMKDEFVANISHELKTPLTSAIGYISMLKQGKLGQIPDEAVGALKITEKNLHELSLKIDSILEDSRLNMDTGYIDRTEFNVAVNLKKCVEKYVPICELKGIQIQWDIPEGDFTIYGSKKEIDNMICNIVDNAVKFTRSGKVEVSIKEARNIKDLVLEFKDTGVGIPKKEIHKIFDRFYQVESSSKRSFGGTGIGLSIVKKIVELHNGSIEIKSKEAEGTIFRVYLPKAGDNDE